MQRYFKYETLNTQKKAFTAQLNTTTKMISLTTTRTSPHKKMCKKVVNNLKSTYLCVSDEERY